jgi:hypothetical protein
MKDIIQKRLLKGVRLVQPGPGNKTKNFNKLDELENVIIAKNVELEKKET